MHTETNLPKHIGLIIDGNRRYARSHMLETWQGHKLGAEKIEEVLEWCKEYDIKELTIYTFSIENFNRSKKEVDYFMKLFKEMFTKYYNDPRLIKDEIKVKFVGNLHLLPEDVQDSINRLQEKTKNNSKYIVNFAIAYGGRDEIINAVKNISKDILDKKIKHSEIDKELFESYLYLKTEPDLIIRTGGYKRSSNFLCYQSAYSEWSYLEKTWPEFSKEDFEQCIQEYSKGKRNFGK